jgi:hypothetical protein
MNVSPQISFPQDWTRQVGSLLTFSASATDSDLPAQMMTFGLDSGSLSGPSIDSATGQFTWTPTSADVGTNTMTLRVTDSGSPALSTSRLLRVVVQPAIRTTISRNGNAISITFETLPGHTYRVQYKDDLNNLNWSQLGSDQSADSSSLTFPDDLTNSPQRFYQVIQLD